MPKQDGTGSKTDMKIDESEGRDKNPYGCSHLVSDQVDKNTQSGKKAA